MLRVIASSCAGATLMGASQSTLVYGVDNFGYAGLLVT